MNFQDQLRNKIQQLNGAEKLIVVHVVCFVLPLFLKTLFFLFTLPFDTFLGWFELSSDWGVFIFKPWTLISYSFLHSGVFHLFWNMYLLYFSSRLFLNLFTVKTFFNVYFLGVLLGGLTFLLSYSIFPVFQNSSPVMIGASAGVMAVFIFMATYSPDYRVSLILFQVKLWHLGLAFVLFDVIQIPSGNAGGHLAHIGGAFLGYFYAKKLKEGTDIGLPFERWVDRWVNLFRKKPKLRTVYRNTTTSSQKRNSTVPEETQKKIDAILDKISDSGYESLTQEEKDILFNAGKK